MPSAAQPPPKPKKNASYQELIAAVTRLCEYVVRYRVLGAGHQDGWTQMPYGQIPPCYHPSRQEQICKAFKVRFDKDSNQYCVDFGEVVLPPGIQPDPPIEVTVEGAPFNVAGDPICLGSFDPETQCLMFCFEFRGGDSENNIPDGQAISFDIQAFPFGGKPADVAGAAAEYDFDGVLESPEENGVIYYPFYDPRLEDPQAVCQNMYLHSCGDRVFQFTPYGG